MSEKTWIVRLEAVIRANEQDILRYFLRRVEHAEDAADLVGDTLLVAWRRHGRVPADDEEARMWLYGVARNVFANHQRGHRRRSALADRLRDALATQPARESSDGSDRRLDVEAAIRQLPEPLREIVTLVHWEGLALVDIASVVRAKPSTVRARYARARALLRDALDPSNTDKSDPCPTTYVENP